MPNRSVHFPHRPFGHVRSPVALTISTSSRFGSNLCLAFVPFGLLHGDIGLRTHIGQTGGCFDASLWTIANQLLDTLVELQLLNVEILELDTLLVHLV
jgi:hypothetical protein